MDLKILTKMLSTRLTTILYYLISSDQTGFNLCRVFVHTQFGPRASVQEALLFLDLEKAFDSIDWTYMRHVLGCMVLYGLSVS